MTSFGEAICSLIEKYNKTSDYTLKEYILKYLELSEIDISNYLIFIDGYDKKMIMLHELILKYIF